MNIQQFLDVIYPYLLKKKKKKGKSQFLLQKKIYNYWQILIAVLTLNHSAYMLYVRLNWSVFAAKYVCKEIRLSDNNDSFCF